MRKVEIRGLFFFNQKTVLYDKLKKIFFNIDNVYIYMRANIIFCY